MAEAQEKKNSDQAAEITELKKLAEAESKSDLKTVVVSPVRPAAPKNEIAGSSRQKPRRGSISLSHRKQRRKSITLDDFPTSSTVPDTMLTESTEAARWRSLETKMEEALGASGQAHADANLAFREGRLSQALSGYSEAIAGLEGLRIQALRLEGVGRGLETVRAVVAIAVVAIRFRS